MKRTYRAIFVLVVTSGLLALLGPVLSRAQDPGPGPSEPRWEAGDSSSSTTEGTMSILRWGAPSSEHPVHHYRVQLLEFGAASPDTAFFDGVTDSSLAVRLQFGCSYRARVAAIDSLGGQSDFSPWTLMYGPEMPFR